LKSFYLNRSRKSLLRIELKVGDELECGTLMLCLECMSTGMPCVHIKASLSGDIPVSQERYTQIGDETGCLS
jgi:hypothetical protein